MIARSDAVPAVTDFHPLYEALYRAAVELVSDEGTVSTSYIQQAMNLPHTIRRSFFG
jgi:hypothetical protein